MESISTSTQTLRETRSNRMGLTALRMKRQVIDNGATLRLSQRIVGIALCLVLEPLLRGPWKGGRISRGIWREIRHINSVGS